MTIPFADIASELQRKCESGRQRFVQAIQQAFDGLWEVELGTPAAWDADGLPQEWDSTGLVFVFQSGRNAGIAVLSDASGLMPQWCSKPDVAGQEKLRVLSRELAASFFPSTNASPDCSVGRVKNLREAMLRAAPSPNSAMLPCTVRCGGQNATLWIVWPTATADEVPLEDQIKSPDAKTQDKGVGATHAPPMHPQSAAREVPRYQEFEEGIGLLPAYSRSLLRIRVPVTVTLATTKQSLSAILNIGTGSIIHFNKSCEDTLTLEVADHKVAVGETVKVGDKFGLWITSMIMPDERFWVISGRPTAVRAR